MMDDFADLQIILTQCFPGEVILEGVPLDMCYWDGGEMYLCDDADEWREIDVADASACDHAETICSACLDRWCADWALRAVAV